jgi:hypothetical protein
MKGFVLAVAALCAAAAANASIPPAYRQHLPLETRVGDIAFVSGGKDREEALSLKRAAQEYPLELVFEEKDRAFAGDFVDGLPVTIRDASGRLVLQAVSRGPIFLARLPKGDYDVYVKWDDWTFAKRLRLGEDRERVVFSWYRVPPSG